MSITSTSMALASPAWPSEALQSSQVVTGNRDDMVVAYVGMSDGELELLDAALKGDD